jgi:diacylglycerol kinase (ATP)
MNTPSCRLIYNPRAGSKRSLLSFTRERVTLEDIIACLDRYEIPVEITPTTGPGDATRLAQEASQRGYDMVIVAGGDGTVGEVANGLIESNTKLAILPLGTFMNVARMLAIPFNLEGAVATIKIGRSAKIDVGCITRENGEKLAEPHYFLESAGIGLDAELQESVSKWERGDRRELLAVLKKFWNGQREAVTLITDNQRIDVRATFVSIANGPYMGPALNATPESQLDDHQLTITMFKARRTELFRFFYTLFRTKKVSRKHLQIIKTKTLTVHAPSPLPLHADARIFGTTPAQFTILPRALHVICGFPKPGEGTLKHRSYINP